MANYSISKIIQQAYGEAYAGGVEEALTHLRRALQLPDQDGLLSEAVGFICFQNARYAEAADAYAVAMQTDPQDARRLYYMALSMSLANRWEDAQASLSRVAAQNPASAAPTASSCLVLLERNDIAAAREAYNRARQTLHDHPRQTAQTMGLMEQCAQAMLALSADVAQQ